MGREDVTEGGGQHTMAGSMRKKKTILCPSSRKLIAKRGQGIEGGGGRKRDHAMEKKPNKPET